MGGQGEVVVGLVGPAWLVGHVKTCRVASNVRADFANLEYVGVFGVFGTGYLKRVPEDVVAVQESIGGYDDAISQ